MKGVALVLFLLISLSESVEGQLMERKEALPGVLVRKGYSPKGYWSSETFNNRGYVQQIDQGRHEELRGRKEFIYNEQGDVLTEIQAYSINRPDTSYLTKYQYIYDAEGFIKQQVTLLHQGDSIIYQGHFVPSDSLWLYERRIVHKQPNGEYRETTRNQYQVTYTNDGRLQSWKQVPTVDYTGSLNVFSYDDNGRLVEKMVKHLPSILEGAAPSTTHYTYEYNRSGYLKTIRIKRSPDKPFERVVRYRYQLK